MTTKYFCDICQHEIKNHRNLQIEYKNGGKIDLDICYNCLYFSPIKELLEKFDPKNINYVRIRTNDIELIYPR